MNAPEGKPTFVPKQAIAPTPQLYDELVADSMVKLAAASLECLGSIEDGSVIHDNACGTGTGTEALMEAVAEQGVRVTVKGSDILEDALDVYRKRAAELQWPAEGVNTDSNALDLKDETFDVTLGNAMLFVLPNDGIDSVKETYRTLKPGGKAIFNSWAYVPNMAPLEAASRATRPADCPLPRAGLEKWTQAHFLLSVLGQGGFTEDQVEVYEKDVYVTVSCGMKRFANMLWSFIGGTTAVGWTREDEERWDEAVGVIERELRGGDGYRDVGDERSVLKFVGNVAVGTK